jgi:hypothetical protein
MARPDVITYLHENLNKFPVEELRKQLLAEGVSDAEFKAALTATQTRRRKAGIRVLLGRLLLAGGLCAVAVAALVSFGGKSDTGEPPPMPQASSGESAFLGHSGYVLKLPADYVAVQRFKDGAKKIEVVHFCKAGTDPTNFLNEGLYGQLGIVRLEASPSPYAGQINGLESLASLVGRRSQSRGEKYALKNVTIGSLRGIQITYEAPDARVETYVLGQDSMYFFMAGQDDEVYRAVLQSLRETHSES